MDLAQYMNPKTAQEFAELAADVLATIPYGGYSDEPQGQRAGRATPDEDMVDRYESRVWNIRAWNQAFDAIRETLVTTYEVGPTTAQTMLLGALNGRHLRQRRRPQPD